MPLIVIEGLDGAGKSTQMELLRRHLTERGRECAYLHFPRFDAPVYGELIARFLRGEMGAVDAVDPYLVALLFAGDRADAAPLLREWLAQGKFVLLDRYVPSNVAYQCAKLEGRERQDALRRWIVELEYGRNAVPRPDAALFLDVPFAFTERSLRAQRSGDDRAYLNGREDIHEASLDFQRRVREMYLRMDREEGSPRAIDCSTPDGGMATPEEVFGRIRTALAGVLE